MEIFSQVAERHLKLATELDAGAAFENYPLAALWNHYILTSYLYYRDDESLIRDDRYDALCKYLHEILKELPNPPLRNLNLIDLDALKAGSGYHIGQWNMPEVLWGAAMEIQRQ